MACDWGKSRSDHDVHDARQKRHYYEAMILGVVLEIGVLHDDVRRRGVDKPSTQCGSLAHISRLAQ